MINREIFSRLSNSTGLSALVGTRIYPNKLPQNPTFPAVTYERISSERFSAFQKDTGRARARFQFDAWSKSYDSSTGGVRQVADEVRLAVQRWRSSTGSIEVLSSLVDNELEIYEDDTETYHVPIDATITYEEPTT